MKLKAALIGCGRAGFLLEEDPLRAKPCTLAGALHSHPQIELISGCDLNTDRLQRFGNKWNIPSENLFHDYKKLFQNQRPDIIAISAWTKTHYEIAMTALDHHPKAILCEKPITARLAQARKLVEKAKQKKIPFFVNHHRRWYFAYQRVREIIKNKELGSLRTLLGSVLTGGIHASWHKNPSLIGGGSLLHDGTHLFDIIRFFCGDVQWLSAKMERNGRPLKGLIEDRGVGMMGLPHQVIAFVEGGGRRKYFQFELDLQFEQGRILIGNHLFKAFRTAPSQNYSGFSELIPDHDILGNDPHAHLHPSFLMADELVQAALKRRWKGITSSGEDAMKAMEIYHAFHRSSKRNGAMIKLCKK